MKKIIMGLVLILLLAHMQVVSAEDEVSTTELITNKTSVEVGESFTVQLWMETNFPVTGFTLRQLKFSGNLADMTDRVFADAWYHAAGTDTGDLDNNEGNLTYAMAFNFTGISGNKPVMQFTFVANNPGTFTIWVPDTITFGSGAGNPGMEIASETGQVFYIIPVGITITITGTGGDDDDDTTPPDDDDDVPPPPIDSDGDGVPDSEDICPGHDDNVDSDGDGIPDGCDDTPYGEEPDPDDDDDDEPPDEVELIANVGGPYFGKVGDTITFDGRGSSGNIVDWNWYFGGSMGSSCYDVVTHSYSKEGNFSISLTVYDVEGHAETDSTYCLIEGYVPDYKPPDEPVDPVDPKEKSIYGEDNTLYYLLLIITFIIIIIIVYLWKRREEDYEE